MRKLQPFDDDRCWCTNLGTIIVLSHTCPLGPVAAGVAHLIVTFDLDLPFTLVKAIRETCCRIELGASAVQHMRPFRCLEMHVCRDLIGGSMIDASFNIDRLDLHNYD